MQLPKSLQKFEDRIADYEVSGEDGSHWVYYKRGWRSYSDPIGCLHQDHEDTLREIAQCVKWARPCDCEDCKMI